MLDGEAFGRIFGTFRHTAFRLETLSVHDVEEERGEFEAFLAGKPMPPDPSDNPWVRSMTELGKSGTRGDPGAAVLASRPVRTPRANGRYPQGLSEFSEAFVLCRPWQRHAASPTTVPRAVALLRPRASDQGRPRPLPDQGW
ncbi:DUF6879 family protein [Streptomyces pinistramenti]|uniref:DUF6879 family protein n=1 Tax=Streptomyces pinistramenti TaxID=2884812 RepID=UPI0035570C53